MEPSIHHIAIAVRDLDTALAFYQDGLGLKMTERREVPEEGVEIAFLPTGQAHDCGEIELLQPLGAESSVARFLEKRGEGLHHICLGVADIKAAVERLQAAGARMLSDEPRVNEHGTRYIFVHPRAVVGHLDQVAATAFNIDIDPGTPCVNGVFHQFLDHRCGTFHDLARGNFIGEHLG